MPKAKVTDAGESKHTIEAVRVLISLTRKRSQMLKLQDETTVLQSQAHALTRKEPKPRMMDALKSKRRLRRAEFLKSIDQKKMIKR